MAASGEDHMTTREDFHRGTKRAVRVGLGVIGCGNITEFRHLPAIVSEVPEIDLKALCNRSEHNLHLLGDRYRVPLNDRYTDYHRLLERDDIHAIIIAASPAANYEIVPEAAKAGKHVFVEKPMAETAKQARVMVESVERAGVKLQVGFNKRYYYAYRKAFELIREGRIGVPTGIIARFWFSPSRRAVPAREQVIAQNGIHILDLVQFLLGPAREVFARDQVIRDRATVTATLAFQSGAVGSILLSSCASWSYPNERLDVVGSNGCCLSAENGRRVCLFVEDKPGLLFEETISAHWLSGHEEAGFALQLQAFARSIQAGKPTDVGPQDGLRSILLAEAIEKSTKTRQPADVPTE